MDPLGCVASSLAIAAAIFQIYESAKNRLLAVWTKAKTKLRVLYELGARFSRRLKGYDNSMLVLSELDQLRDCQNRLQSLLSEARTISSNSAHPAVTGSSLMLQRSPGVIEWQSVQVQWQTVRIQMSDNTK